MTPFSIAIRRQVPRQTGSYPGTSQYGHVLNYLGFNVVSPKLSSDSSMELH